jgi:hypothetical protein
MSLPLVSKKITLSGTITSHKEWENDDKED